MVGGKLGGADGGGLGGLGEEMLDGRAGRRNEGTPDGGSDSGLVIAPVRSAVEECSRVVKVELLVGIEVGGDAAP